MVRNWIIWILFAGVAQVGHAQAFKVGDFVNYNSFADTWLPCKVSRLEGTHYFVSCGAIDYFADAPVLRARAATAEDQRVDAENAAALVRQASRTGSSLEAQYGTREPVKCASQAAPARGAPSAEQARQYVICDTEREAYPGTPWLVTNVKVQVAAVSHPPNQIVVNMRGDIDVRQPIWDIRGSLTRYSCAKLDQIPGWPTGVNAFARVHTCEVDEMPVADGYCYKNTFGDWHCSMLGAIVNAKQSVLPPEGY